MEWHHPDQLLLFLRLDEDMLRPEVREGILYYEIAGEPRGRYWGVPIFKLEETYDSRLGNIYVADPLLEALFLTIAEAGSPSRLRPSPIGGRVRLYRTVHESFPRRREESAKFSELIQDPYFRFVRGDISDQELLGLPGGQQRYELIEKKHVERYLWSYFRDGFPYHVPFEREFVKLNAQGEPLPVDAQAWDCVLDRSTGLVWEAKAEEGPRAYRKVYRWHVEEDSARGRYWGYGSEPQGVCEQSLCDAAAYVDLVNDMQLCGFDDWRVPVQQEMASIVLPEGPNQVFFPNRLRKGAFGNDPYGPDDMTGPFWVAPIAAMSVRPEGGRPARWNGVWGREYSWIDRAPTGAESHLRLVRGVAPALLPCYGGVNPFDDGTACLTEPYHPGF
ncbi:hypothetical protein CAL65_17035 [Alkalilimnicola ehrlichii]|uniref:Lcl C-terminal domain-containing protein n=1 Tax=Alkalilimnicola ehrlichii TaxID=351052 RepID=A0A3E0WMB8_9GAMM|nr:hypothetical protein CAL65_17035 [Alkalilimnicola ehrlichii]